MNKFAKIFGLGALIIIGATSTGAFAADDYDPSRAFIDRLAGRQTPVGERGGATQIAGNPAQDFIDRLAGIDSAASEPPLRIARINAPVDDLR